ncbi:MAG: hypothetical protein DI624_04410 [Brevundimonas sp.]|nr:hypothetical protein [uncultured Brevundimonas sp.]PZT99918.1 MAG: hypothetical protein DI624_04410 [Brevundimonas sp.]
MRHPVTTAFGGLRLVFQLLLLLAVFSPAVSAHACVDETCAYVAAGVQAVPDDAQGGCPDCGPACANGCCHAPHPAALPGPAFMDQPTPPALRLSWSHSPERPPLDPAGLRRPPRA